MPAPVAVTSHAGGEAGTVLQQASPAVEKPNIPLPYPDARNAEPQPARFLQDASDLPRFPHRTRHRKVHGRTGLKQ